jgi:hypothetical protein
LLWVHLSVGDKVEGRGGARLEPDQSVCHEFAVSCSLRRLRHMTYKYILIGNPFHLNYRIIIDASEFE